MTLSQAPIAIVGAGPSGLALARLLELANIPYVVFERDESAAWADEHASSGTLDIHESSGQLVLKEAGLLSEFQSSARYNVPTRIVDSQGAVHADLPGDDNNDKPEIDRKELRRLLLSSIPAERIRWCCNIRHVQKDEDGTVSIHGADGSIMSRFHLVIGADGAWSKVRKLVTSTRPQYSGIHFFTTFIKPEDPRYATVTSMAGNGNYLAMGKGRQIFLHYLSDRSYHLSVGARLLEEWIRQDKLLQDPSELWQALLQNEFAGWTRELTKLIQSNDRHFRSWPLYSMPEESKDWNHVPGVTLLGDAAHLAVPSGCGVNDALYDALELARRIISHGIGDLDSAIVGYEEALGPRATDTIRQGHWFAEYFFGADGPGEFLQAASAR